MFEMLEKLESMFDGYYAKGYILIAIGIAVLMLLYFIFVGFK